MIILCCVTVIALAMWGIYAAKKRDQYFPPPMEYAPKETEENDDERDRIQAEINTLYYHLELLQRLEEAQNVQPDCMDERRIKKALTTDKAILATRKKIETLERKMTSL